jgi:hypothetical protein
MTHHSDEVGKLAAKQKMGQLGLGYRMTPWAIGDLWNQMVALHGETWCLQNLESMSGLKTSHLLDFSYVARRYPNEKYRHYGLSLWHHRDVLSLPPDVREKFLKLAEIHKLTTVDLRRLKKSWRDAGGAKTPESLVLERGLSVGTASGG